MPSRQYVLKIFSVVVTIGLLVFLSAGSFTASLRASALGWSSGILKAVGATATHLTGWLGGSSGKRIAELESGRVELLAALAERENLVQENETLGAALGLKQDGVLNPVPVPVIGFVRDGRDEYLLLGRGTQDGIAAGDVVVSREKVFVGTIADASSRVAHVALITSPSRSTDIEIASRNIHAVARGNNDRELIVDLVPQQSDVRTGDLVVASPRATGLAKPLLVGEVREVKQAANEVFQSVSAFHLFNPADDEVIVLAAP